MEGDPSTFCPISRDTHRHEASPRPNLSPDSLRKPSLFAQPYLHVLESRVSRPEFSLFKDSETNILATMSCPCRSDPEASSAANQTEDAAPATLSSNAAGARVAVKMVSAKEIKKRARDEREGHESHDRKRVKEEEGTGSAAHGKIGPYDGESQLGCRQLMSKNIK